MKPKKQANNLIPYAHELRDSDLAFIKRAVNLYGDVKVDEGGIMFLNREYAVKCLTWMVEAVSSSSEAEIRKAKRIISKLGGDNSASAEFEMFLNPIKVGKFSREIGAGLYEINSRIKTVRNAGIQFQHFGNKYVSPEVLVEHKILVRALGNGKCRVKCAKSIVEEVKGHLFRNYR